jgi:segregation and condensation protein B
MEQEKLKSAIESLLFVNGDPMKLSQIVKITGAPKPEVENAIMMLSGEYGAGNKGLVIIKKGEEVQMATSPENSAYVEQLVANELQGYLTQAALEVVSIVAYRQPITRAEIEAIRGVNSSYTLRNLLMRGLVERSDNPKDNRGYIYSISFDFLKKLGIDDIKKLPDFEDLSKDERINSIIGD